MRGAGLVVRFTTDFGKIGTEKYNERFHCSFSYRFVRLAVGKITKLSFFYRFYYRFAVTAVVILVELVFEGSVDLFACLLKKDDCMWVEAC